VNNDNHIIVGLPPPRQRSSVTCHRSFGLSVMHRALRNLKPLVEYETATLRVGPCQELVHANKYRQLYGLLRSLLSREEGPGLPPELEDLLDDADEHYPLDLRALRAFGMHQLQSSRLFSRGVLRPAPCGRRIWVHPRWFDGSRRFCTPWKYL